MEIGTFRPWVCATKGYRPHSHLPSACQRNCRDELVWSCTAWQPFVEEHGLHARAERHHLVVKWQLKVVKVGKEQGVLPASVVCFSFIYISKVC